MDKETRNRIQKATQAARSLLEQDFEDQLAGVFDIRSDGTVAEGPGSHLDAAQRIVRGKLVAAVGHFRAGGQTAADAVASHRREAAFTTLNRFAALKMLEARSLVQECISRGEQSLGFKEFCGLAPGLVQLPDRGYRLYLESLFDELSVQVRVLFNRRDAGSLLWPKRATLEGLLAILNAPELSGVWGEDETIGWLYQYYNDEGERKRMREESAAPRNSRELAVRNQFFTPRYVVEFLTDNTLGRLWYEMTRGQTRLKDQCRYLVRRPKEVFLKPGESAPEGAGASGTDGGDALSQEELLVQPVHIPHRSLKDPREILLLDPACGSMHFGLYAFDLFEVIYDEAWDLDLPSSPARGVGGEGLQPLHDLYATKDDYLRDIPRLIIEHNIHGIDIDRRAVQIAGLSLWLRAQRAWNQAGVRPADRPRIARSNIVCGEPMPGEKELLREFVEQQFPAAERPAFAFLLEKVFDRMTLAGEAGSLLRIEEEIRDAIAEARALAQSQSAPRQLQLLPTDEPPEQAKLDLSGLTDEQFWEAAEGRIYHALQLYAEQAENGSGFRRRLFVEDASQGFAFIDLLRRRYDVVLMNPPFGDSTPEVARYLEEHYSETRLDLFAAFCERLLELAQPTGFIGAITPRDGFFKKTLGGWRQLILANRLTVVADLGIGVLDAATVRVAAYVIARGKLGGTSRFIDLVDLPDRDACLRQQAATPGRHVDVDMAKFQSLPLGRFLYWLPARLWEIYNPAKDQDLLRDASQYAGATRTDLKTKPGLVDDPAVILSMRAHELKKLTPAALSEGQLHAGYQRALAFGLRALAFEMLLEWVRRSKGQTFDQGHFEDLISSVLQAGDLEVARRIRDHCGDHAWWQPEAIAFRFDLLENPARFDPLERDCRKAVCQTSDKETEFDEPLIRLAYDFAPRHPALAITFARAAIASNPERHLDNAMLLEVIGDARVDLDLAADGDPAEVLFDWIEDRTRIHEKAQAENRAIERLTNDLNATLTALDEKKQALRQTEQALRTAGAELEEARGSLVGPQKIDVAQAFDSEKEAALRRLRNQVTGLKAEIGEQQTERRQLRRMLANERKKLADLSQPETPAEDPGAAEEAGGVEPTGRPILPDYTDAFRKSLASLPPSLAAKAILAAGRFASHEAAIWRQTKPLERLPEHYRIRVGLDYRLMVHWQPGKVLRILDVIPRQDLESWIRRQG